MVCEYGVGILGCGNIFVVYFKLILLFKNLKVVVCVDINLVVVEVWVVEFGVCVEMVEVLLVDLEVDVIVNLMILEVYFVMLKWVFEVGKYVYLEKFFVFFVEEGEEFCRIVDIKGLCVGLVLDMFFGGVY